MKKHMCCEAHVLFGCDGFSVSLDTDIPRSIIPTEVEGSFLLAVIIDCLTAGNGKV